MGWDWNRKHQKDDRSRRRWSRSHRTRRAVVRLLAYLPSEHNSQRSQIRDRKRNFDLIDMNAPHYYEKLQEEFRRLHGLGLTFREIAEALNISERTVTAWREELDLPRRPRGRRPRKSGGTVQTPRVGARTINGEETLP
jgi:hypothetical protein